MQTFTLPIHEIIVLQTTHNFMKRYR
jgi:hypothetical protein